MNMENTQITLDDLVSSYQKEIASLVHNKIITGIQVEKLTTQLEFLVEENNNLKEKVSQLETKTTKRNTKASTEEF